MKFLLVGHDCQERDFSYRDPEEFADQLGEAPDCIHRSAGGYPGSAVRVGRIAYPTSLSEGFSNTILEFDGGREAGRWPTNVGGNPEAVVEGETGYWCRRRTLCALATRIVELLEQEELAKAMGKGGRESAASMFCLAGQAVDQYEELFRELLER